MVLSQESDDVSLALKVIVLPFHAFEQPGGTLLSFTSEKLLPSSVARLCKTREARRGVSHRRKPRSIERVGGRGGRLG